VPKAQVKPWPESTSLGGLFFFSLASLQIISGALRVGGGKDKPLVMM